MTKNRTAYGLAMIILLLQTGVMMYNNLGYKTLVIGLLTVFYGFFMIKSEIVAEDKKSDN